MSEPWQGTYTAVVTPFQADGSVDEPALERLVDLQIEGGVEGIVPCGTTGESVTLSGEEQLRVIQLVRERVDTRVRVIAGVGGNCTERVVAQARAAASLGVEGILSVVPYYNKPTQEGMFRHFSELADAIEIPVIVYNVPGRTSANILPDTLMRLAEHENIRGVKRPLAPWSSNHHALAATSARDRQPDAADSGPRGRRGDLGGLERGADADESHGPGGVGGAIGRRPGNPFPALGSHER